MSSWHSYPSSYALGHKAIADLLLGPVTVEEKVDGSQFSFAKFFVPGEVRFELKFRSKGAEIYVSPEGKSSEKMFQKAVDAVLARAGLLAEGWTYRAEFLPKPKAVTLAYDRPPKDYLILFDVNDGEESYLTYAEKATEADRIGLEVVPLLYSGSITDIKQISDLLETKSVLGGQKVEGVVVKNYSRFGLDKKIMVGKYVSEEFKEIHGKEWKTGNPANGDIIQLLGNSVRTPARWNKAIQHLKETGKLEGSPRDIALLFQEVPADIEKECREEIIDQLWKWAWPKIRRIATAGLAEHYKKELLSQQPTAEVQAMIERSGTDYVHGRRVVGGLDIE